VARTNETVSASSERPTLDVDNYQRDNNKNNTQQHESATEDDGDGGGLGGARSSGGASSSFSAADEPPAGFLGESGVAVASVARGDEMDQTYWTHTVPADEQFKSNLG
jgi:hypothetical protein